MLLSVGELNKNKNHAVVIQALAKIKNPQIHYFIAGSGKLKEKLELLSKKLGIERQVHLLGYRNDIRYLLQMADIYLLPSRREGLNVSLMEAMASGVPCIVSRIRGNVDLIGYKEGVLFNPNNVIDVKNAITKIMNLTDDEFIQLGYSNLKKIGEFDKENVKKSMFRLYSKLEKQRLIKRLQE